MSGREEKSSKFVLRHTVWLLCILQSSQSCASLSVLTDTKTQNKDLNSNSDVLQNLYIILLRQVTNQETLIKYLMSKSGNNVNKDIPTMKKTLTEIQAELMIIKEEKNQLKEQVLKHKIQNAEYKDTLERHETLITEMKEHAEKLKEHFRNETQDLIYRLKEQDDLIDAQSKRLTEQDKANKNLEDMITELKERQQNETQKLFIRLKEQGFKQLQTDVKQSQGQMQNVQQDIHRLKENIKGITKSVVYVRWGRRSCPSHADLLYEGNVGGSYYGHSGGAVDPLCLPKNPQYYANTPSSTQGQRGLLYGAEYQNMEGAKHAEQHNYDVPCAVCRAKGKSSIMVLPARYNCLSGSRLEYSGYLMAGKYSHTAASMYTCVDKDPEVIPNTSADRNGYLLLPVEGRCGSLPCPPYKQGKEISCAVCSYE